MTTEIKIYLPEIMKPVVFYSDVIITDSDVVIINDKPYALAYSGHSNNYRLQMCNEFTADPISSVFNSTIRDLQNLDWVSAINLMEKGAIMTSDFVNAPEYIKISSDGNLIVFNSETKDKVVLDNIIDFKKSNFKCLALANINI